MVNFVRYCPKVGGSFPFLPTVNSSVIPHLYQAFKCSQSVLYFVHFNRCRVLFSCFNFWSLMRYDDEHLFAYSFIIIYISLVNVLHLLPVFNHVIYFIILEFLVFLKFILDNNSYWICLYPFFSQFYLVKNTCLILFWSLLSILLRTFICIHKWYWSVDFSFYGIFSDLIWYWSHWMSWDVVPHFIRRLYEKMELILFLLNVWV